MKRMNDVAWVHTTKQKKKRESDGLLIILRCHQFRLGAIWTDYVFFFVGDEAAADER